VGKKLTASELKRQTVVVVRRDDRPYAATLWVETITPEFVVFLAGEPDPKIHFVVERRADGTMADDTGTEIKVYEYLGAL
jgi:hypothetical protein